MAGLSLGEVLSLDNRYKNGKWMSGIMFEGEHGLMFFVLW